PEILLGAAMADLLSAMTSARDMRDLAAEDGVAWGLEHGFLANMGGFVVHFGDEQEAALHSTSLSTNGERFGQTGSQAPPDESLGSHRDCHHERTDPSFMNRQNDPSPIKGENESPLRFPGLRLDEEIIDDEFID